MNNPIFQLIIKLNVKPHLTKFFCLFLQLVSFYLYFLEASLRSNIEEEAREEEREKVMRKRSRKGRRKRRRVEEQKKRKLAFSLKVWN